MYGSNAPYLSHTRYRAVKVQTASPPQVLLMLYDGAVRFTQLARRKVLEGDLGGKGTYIGKTQAILSELMGTLNFEAAPELCTRLQQLYIYMMEQLSVANVERRVEPLDVVVDLLITLRDGWREAVSAAATAERAS